MARLDSAIAWLVYASVLLGVLFLYVIQGIPTFPAWLLYSIVGGEALWIVCAVAVARRLKWAPYLAVVLAVITLAVSLPQPTHYSFAETGQVLDFSIFAGGAVLQVALIVAAAAKFLRRPH